MAARIVRQRAQARIRVAARPLPAADNRALIAAATAAVPTLLRSAPTARLRGATPHRRRAAIRLLRGVTLRQATAVPRRLARVPRRVTVPVEEVPTAVAVPVLTAIAEFSFYQTKARSDPRSERASLLRPGHFPAPVASGILLQLCFRERVKLTSTSGLANFSR